MSNRNVWKKDLHSPSFALYYDHFWLSSYYPSLSFCVEELISMKMLLRHLTCLTHFLAADDANFSPDFYHETRWWWITGSWLIKSEVALDKELRESTYHLHMTLTKETKSAYPAGCTMKATQKICHGDKMLLNSSRSVLSLKSVTI